MTSRAPEEQAWVGIDLGTQSVRALVVQFDGIVLGSGSSPLTSMRDGHRHEQDPEQWWTAVCAATRQALVGVNAPIGAVAVDGTSGTILLANAHSIPLTRGLMYDDGRAGGHLDEVNRAGEDLWTKLGYRHMQPSWALPKLVWLRQNHPQAMEEDGTQLLHQTDFINRRLAGRNVATDLSSALKTGVDLIAESWPSQIIDSLHLAASLFPPVVRSGHFVANVSTEAAEQTGLPEGIPIISGATDGCAAQLGAGALNPGDWNSVVGTTLVLKGVSENLLHDPHGVVYSHKGPEGQWLPGGASSSGAGVIARDFEGADLRALALQAAEFHPGATTYPLVSEGERFPFAAAGAREFTIGHPETAAARYGAVLQGLAFVERLSFDYLGSLGADTSGRLLLTGGATNSSYWSQLRADILGREVWLPQNAEPSLGAAILAAAGASGRRSPEVAADMVQIGSVIAPREDYAGRFDPAYATFVEHLENRGWLSAGVASHARRIA
ncbi:FGGY-family carbohydrate kinase [Arthrobacter tumbae]|uniref:FGGY-family carbohydrate kinase n=1 Tax=Arthrobacter tumbae TaxID=163874 RepID=UPI00195CF2F0|nr:FGGY family carbohydrate kinase [Arthrobacter tumbae]MBM7780892.1 sugar (pentulose or hexulose) kinase [Arthrobacter tumbae]